LAKTKEEFKSFRIGVATILRFSQILLTKLELDEEEEEEEASY